MRFVHVVVHQGQGSSDSIIGIFLLPLNTWSLEKKQRNDGTLFLQYFGLCEIHAYKLW